MIMKSPCRGCEHVNENKESFVSCKNCKKIKDFQQTLLEEESVKHLPSFSTNTGLENLKRCGSGYTQKVNRRVKKECMQCGAPVKRRGQLCDACNQKGAVCIVCGERKSIDSVTNGRCRVCYELYRRKHKKICSVCGKLRVCEVDTCVYCLRRLNNWPGGKK